RAREAGIPAQALTADRFDSRDAFDRELIRKIDAYAPDVVVLAFIFGNTAEEVEALRRQGYKPRDYYEKDEELHQVLTQIGSGVF
ncbi:glycogen/starch/alpha-glucan phosphorylase, partial [Salmonella enterica subsp. enterica serovar Montevideo]|nr:glycogen/starch/alpha-glucan phosphorylase [Salmonella enterica subsp. enterica serovar Montevideo]